MDGNEKQLPKGWIKVKSKSRPDKFYFYHIEKKLSLWKFEDVDKINQGKLQTSKPKTKTMTIQDSGIGQDSKVIKKNGARDRMAKLQKVLANEVKRGNEGTSEAPKSKNIVKKSNVKKIEKHEDSIIKITSKLVKAQKKPLKDPTENKNVAAQRMKKLKTELTSHESGRKVHKEKTKQESKAAPSPQPNHKPEKAKNPPEPPQKVASQDDVEMMDISFENESEELIPFEPMDWEEIPEEVIVQEIQKIRRLNSAEDREPTERKSVVSLAIEFYVVVDTNVLISNLEYVKVIKGKVFKDIGKATIFLPYIVLNELDRLKTREENVAKLARRAIAFIDECFNSRDPFFVGQSGAGSLEKRMIPIDSGDDEILNCCLQIQEITKKIILLSNDKNLRNKAFVNGIANFSKDMLNFVDFNAKNELTFD